MIFLAQPYDSTDATRPYFFTISRNFVAFHTKLFEIFFKLNYLFIHKFPAVVLHTWFWVLLRFYLFFPWNVFYNIIFGYPLTLIDHLPWKKEKQKWLLYIRDKVTCSIIKTTRCSNKSQPPFAACLMEKLFATFPIIMHAYGAHKRKVRLPGTSHEAQAKVLRINLTFHYITSPKIKFCLFEIQAL